MVAIPGPFNPLASKPVLSPEQTTGVCGPSTSDNRAPATSRSRRRVTVPSPMPRPALGRTMRVPPEAVLAGGTAEVTLEVFSAARGDPRRDLV